MIYGIGTDIVEIARIKSAIETSSDRFLDRIYTAQEKAAAEKRENKPRFYAMRWAAKEAAWKALSPGQQSGIGWHDLEIVTDQNGKPSVIFHGAAKEYFDQQTKGQGRTDLSLSDDGGMALAFVVLSAS